MIVDTFMFGRELDMLECRLTELGDVVDRFVIVEADVDHQDHPKPFYLSENLDRFDAWQDQLVVVRAKGLPTAQEAPDPWAREHAQREFVAEGLTLLGVSSEDVILHGDCDEIPTRLVARNLRPRGLVALTMRGHFFAVDWLHPEPWRGTVAAKAGNVRSFNQMRDARNFAPPLHDAGWHLSWLGGHTETLAKLGSFCHPEISDRTHAGLEEDWFYRDGVHTDGVRMKPVDVDRSWPQWVFERRCPESWFRPR